MAGGFFRVRVHGGIGGPFDAAGVRGEGEPSEVPTGEETIRGGGVWGKGGRWTKFSAKSGPQPAFKLLGRSKQKVEQFHFGFGSFGPL